MWKPFDRLEEKKFEVLRGSLTSGRQSPNSLGGILLFAPLGFGLFIFLSVLFVINGWDSRVANAIFTAYIIIFSLLIVLALIYAIPNVYWKSQKMQYFLSIIVSQLSIIFLYSAALFFLADEVLWGYNSSFYKITESTFITYVCITTFLGVITFVIAFIRFYRLLKRGKFLSGTKRDTIRTELEASPQSGLMGAIFAVGLISAILLGVSLLKVFGVSDPDLLFGVSIFGMLFYVMMFILPEQVIILYCKRRFKSFNFDKEGNVFPMASGDKVIKKKG